jgi:hypothetical protein
MMKRSETIGALAKALTAFNSEVSKVSKDAANPFFKNNYASLDNIIDEVRPILTKNGLTLMQFPSGDGQNVSVTTYLMHESGEWIESDPLIMKPVKNDPQAIGSCITYARRYSLQSFLSLNTGEDDDGNKATHTKQPEPKQTANTGHYEPKKISTNQLKMLNSLITRMDKEKGLARERVIETLRKKDGIGQFDSTANLSVGQASKAIETLQTALGDK